MRCSYAVLLSQEKGLPRHNDYTRLASTLNLHVMECGIAFTVFKHA